MISPEKRLAGGRFMLVSQWYSGAGWSWMELAGCGNQSRLILGKQKHSDGVNKAVAAGVNVCVSPCVS